MGLDGEFVRSLGRERLDGQIELGGSAGGDGRVTGHGQGGDVGDIIGTAARESEFLSGEINVIRTDNVLGSRKGDLVHLDGGSRRVGQVDGDDGCDVLHGDDRRIIPGDVLRYTVNRKVLSGEMGHAVGTGLGLGRIGLGTDGQITGFRVGRRRDIAAVRIEQIPVVGIGGQFGGTLGVVVRGVIDLELGIRGILRGTGRCGEHIERISVFPLGAHAVVDGTGCGIAEDDFDGTAVKAFDIGFLVTADERQGGSSQTRKEKEFFHHLVLFGFDLEVDGIVVVLPVIDGAGSGLHETALVTDIDDAHDRRQIEFFFLHGIMCFLCFGYNRCKFTDYPPKDQGEKGGSFSPENELPVTLDDRFSRPVPGRK